MVYIYSCLIGLETKMERLKKSVAFKRAVQCFGDWRTWSRWEHIAYGLIRGVSYARMERCSNDAIDHWSITKALLQLGAWLEPSSEYDPGKIDTGYALNNKHRPEVAALAPWVRKPVRVKKVRPSRVELASATGE